MSIETTLRYMDHKPGGEPESLHRQISPRPEPGPGEVLLKVAAAGVNRPDVLQRQGQYPPPEGASPILGLEVSGEVATLGPAVSRWQPGDQVCALVNGGGYADYVLAQADQCLPLPAGMSLTQAAALPEALFTVWHNLWQRAGLRAGEWLLIHGGASGIGTTAIQMARAMNVKVLVTAGGPDKCRACETLGAEAAIDYREQDFVAEVKRLTDGQGVQVILDMVGGDYIQRNFSAAAKEGRIVNIAFLKGSRAEVDFIPLMLKRLTLTGSTLRAQSDGVKATIARELEEYIWPLLKLGRIKPQVNHQFPLEQAADAHRLMESNRLIGKIVLTVDS